MIGYTISSILWAFGGLVVGFFIGRGGQSSVTSQAGGDELSSKPPGGVTVEATVHRFRDSLTFDRLVGWVVVVLAIVSVLTVSYTVGRQQQSVACQADYNARFVVALDQRSEAAAADRQAIRELLTGMLTTRDPATSRNLIDAYLKKLDAADSQRDDNPLPQRPIC